MKVGLSPSLFPFRKGREGKGRIFMALNQIALLLFSHFYSPFATVFQLASESTSPFSLRQRNVHSKRVAPPSGSLPPSQCRSVINSLDRSEHGANAVRGESISPSPIAAAAAAHKTNPTDDGDEPVSSHCNHRSLSD